jgi:hypothetical protein
MLLFRSEEHVDRWCRQHNCARDGTMTLDQQWRLARAWHGDDRRAPEWRRKSVEEAEEVFAAVGLVGDFWRLR